MWRWLLGCQWRRLAQEEPFVQRTAEVGDELGSSVLAARLARDVMRLALLIARRYAPYSKWLGTAFARLDHPDGLDRFLADAVRAPDLEAREAALGKAYEAIARRFNALGLIEPVDPELRQFHNRPARVLIAYRFADPCLESVADPALRALPPSAGSTRSRTRRTRSTIRTCSAASGTCGPDVPARNRTKPRPFVRAPARIEPGTFGLRVRCSAS